VITVHECEHMLSTKRVRRGLHTACAGDDSTSCLLLSGSCRSCRRNWVRHSCKNAIEAVKRPWTVHANQFSEKVDRGGEVGVGKEHDIRYSGLCLAQSPQPR
jgi:hypothetical protein